MTMMITIATILEVTIKRVCSYAPVSLSLIDIHFPSFNSAGVGICFLHMRKLRLKGSFPKS